MFTGSEVKLVMSHLLQRLRTKSIIVNRYPRTVPPCPRQPADNVLSKLISYFVMRYYFRLNSTSTHLFDRFVQQSVYIIIYNTIPPLCMKGRCKYI